ncbi:MAG TPA: hypothetical protein VME63_13735 [Dyella sp.]|uniref:hypothetical protein n=1 Tax=Dyella sp. TaxID=1869338 RepID=UPI002C08664A|nr:hypothetical protein [Dyella sp.]HTV86469.1 hypothetical protein [Dyella sp.]
MISTRPNIPYLKAAWAAHASISAANCRQTYEEAGITFERVNHSWIVRKGPTQVSTMPLRYTRQDLRMGFLGRIEMEARKAASEMEAVLFHDLLLPEDHAMIVEVEQSMRQLRRRGSRALTILVGPTVLTHAPGQFYAEIHALLDAPRAFVYAHRTNENGCAPTDLLVDVSKRERHPRAPTYAELARRLAETLNAAIQASTETAALTA